jgi:hypothetical protein
VCRANSITHFDLLTELLVEMSKDSLECQGKQIIPGMVHFTSIESSFGCALVRSSIKLFYSNLNPL